MKMINFRRLFRKVNNNREGLSCHNSQPIFGYLTANYNNYGMSHHFHAVNIRGCYSFRIRCTLACILTQLFHSFSPYQLFFDLTRLNHLFFLMNLNCDGRNLQSSI